MVKTYPLARRAVAFIMGGVPTEAVLAEMRPSDRPVHDLMGTPTAVAFCHAMTGWKAMCPSLQPGGKTVRTAGLSRMSFSKTWANAA